MQFPTSPTPDLKRLDDAFEKAQPRSASDQAAPDDVPDGSYEVIIEEVRLTTTMRTGNPMIIWRLRIVSGPCEGQSLSKIRVLSEKTIEWAKEDLLRCGLALNRLSELEFRAPEMVGKEMSVFKRTRNGWVDVYFMKTMAAGAGMDGDDLPF